MITELVLVSLEEIQLLKRRSYENTPVHTAGAAVPRKSAAAAERVAVRTSAGPAEAP